MTLIKPKKLLIKVRNATYPSKYLREAQFDYLKELAQFRRWESYEQVLKKLESDSKAWPDLIYLNNLLSQVYLSTGRFNISSKIDQKTLNIYNKLRAKGSSIPLEGLDAVAKIWIKDLNTTFSKLKNIKLAYPEKKFNSKLKEKFELLDQVINKVLNVFEIGSGKGVVEAYDILIICTSRISP